jgi:hypothetical protein
MTNLQPTNDAMYYELSQIYGPYKTLGDLLNMYFQQYDKVYRGSKQYEWYDATDAVGATVGDIANSFWNDADYVYSNVNLEDGTDFLMEDGSFVALEVGNL